jgi:hypothetical protein
MIAPSQLRRGDSQQGVEVSDFENTHGISLPPDYRSFLISVGNGS